MFVFDPLVISNGSLALNDMFVTAFFFLSLLFIWMNVRKRPSVTLLAGVCAGLAIGSKLSGLLVLPLSVLIFYFQASSDKKTFFKNILIFSGAVVVGHAH